jgi:hypothetical protein
MKILIKLEINKRIPKHSHIIKVYNFYNNSYSMEYLQDYQQLSENYIETLSLHQRESVSSGENSSGSPFCSW